MTRPARKKRGILDHLARELLLAAIGLAIAYGCYVYVLHWFPGYWDANVVHRQAGKAR